MSEEISVKHTNNGTADKFVVSTSSKKLELTFFKANGIYFVNINNAHIIDYKQFAKVKNITQMHNGKDITLSIGSGSASASLLIKDCDVEMIQKALIVMSEFMKTKSSLYKDLIYILFH